MKSLKVAVLGLGLALASASLLATTSGEALAGWEPKKPVEFVIMAGKGGGADKMARLMQTVIEKNGWSSKPLTPINKPGGSGAEALVHLKSKGQSDPDHPAQSGQDLVLCIRAQCRECEQVVVGVQVLEPEELELGEVAPAPGVAARDDEVHLS